MGGTMKSKIQWFVPLFVLIILCGCGAFFWSRSKNPGEPSVVSSGSAESAVFTNSATSVKESRLENDYIRIWPHDIYNGIPKWSQENLNGTDKKEVNIKNLSMVLWLNNDWIYYTCHNGVYRAPVDPKKKTSFKLSKKELLFKTQEIKFSDIFKSERSAENQYTYADTFVTDDYLFYSKDDFENYVTRYYRYDFKSGKSTEVFSREGISNGLGVIGDASTMLPVICGNYFFVEGEEGIHRISLDTLEKKQIFSGDELEIYSVVEYDEAIYFCGKAADFNEKVVQVDDSRQNIIKYDPEKEEAAYVVTEKVFREILEPQLTTLGANAKEFYYAINLLDTYQDRLYCSLIIANNEELLSGKEVLLSAAFTDLERWELEETLMQYCLAHGMKTGSYGGGKGSTSIITINDGKVLFCISTGEKVEDPQSGIGYYYKQDYVVYDLKTGDFKPYAEDGSRQALGTLWSLSFY